MAGDGDFTHISAMVARDMKVRPIPKRIVQKCYGGDRDRAEAEIASLLELPDMLYAWLSKNANAPDMNWKEFLSSRPGSARMLAMVYLESINEEGQ